ncbi:MAG: hypothetical protein BJ554DRAFT_466 [Olpidium bornovanus]|uniref:Uncharacterized protein n=1 Tax=Olpidium bornovanus TaxID=278681 RepID=A0A8H7ZTQ3_9FUNG|nr:MAG: hypothetical protein BJ554DRAFT_466 [Olpidium bornovanus]
MTLQSAGYSNRRRLEGLLSFKDIYNNVLRIVTTMSGCRAAKHIDSANETVESFPADSDGLCQPKRAGA